MAQQHYICESGPSNRPTSVSSYNCEHINAKKLASLLAEKIDASFATNTRNKKTLSANNALRQ